MNKQDKLNEIIKTSEHIVFFGGAGVSVPSGIPDFRSAKGLYQEKYQKRYSPEQMVSHSFFVHNTSMFFDFYFDKMVHLDARPNACHKKLYELEQRKKIEAVITQNIDGLHQMAGSKRVIELHGSVHRNYCMSCGKYYDLIDLDLEGIPRCSCGGIIKPDVVLYEEQLDEKMIASAILAISKADTLIIGGTSLAVYPAAGLIQYFKGKHIVVINLESSAHQAVANNKEVLFINDDIAEVFKKIE